MDVTIRKQSMVRPLEPTPQRILWNSNVDLVIPRIHTQSVYFYNPDGAADFFNHEKLAEALGKALVPFYPMAGRLKRGEGGRIEINCNAQGVLLVEAEANAVVADFGEFAPDPRFRQLVPQVDYDQDISSFPLLVLQVTFFDCGGVSLGVGMQHHVADGMSGIHCINTWSEMMRGIPLKVHPFIDRTLLKANSPPAPKYPHIEYQDPPKLLKREIGDCIGNGNGCVKGDSYMNSNGHCGNGSRAVNGKSNGSHVGNGKSNGNHIENGNCDGRPVQNGKSNGSHIENGKSNGGHVENGKSNGSPVQNGKSNGSHIENGKSNGSHIENGKSNGSHVENGKSSGSPVQNGKSNGSHIANGKSNGRYNENGSHVENGKSNGSHVENGKSNGSHIGNGKSNGSHVENGKSNGSHIENGKSNGSHVENGKSNGSHIENGKSNGSHVENGKSNGSHFVNGKSNGSHVENGKSNGSHVVNGKSNGSHIENGKSNGSHVENGKSNESHIENGKSNGSHVENRKSNGSHIENGKSNGNHFENGKSNGSHIENGKSSGRYNESGNHVQNGKSNGVSNGNSNEVYDDNRNCNGEQKDAQLTLASAFHKLKEEDIPMAVRVFKFTSKQMATLKQMAVEAKTDVTFSSYEMLSGHIWKCVTQARNLQHSQETKLFIATDGRSRLAPPLPKGYFGNVIFTCTPIATASELVANPVTYAARKIHDALARMNNEYLRSALDYLETQEDVSQLVRCARHFNSPNLGITSWARMPVYECDFGWGKPIFMGPCAIAYEGLAYVLGNSVYDGSLSLSLGLRADHMAAFANLVTNI